MIKPISGLELQIMTGIWTLKDCSIKEAADTLCKSKPKAYTTVSTVVQRLCAKGLLKKYWKGASFRYAPTMSKQDYANAVAVEFTHMLSATYPEEACQSVAASIRSLPPDHIERILRELRSL